ncbi:GntR family transcriptional regulator [Halalkalibacter krulwichiae]|uniref:HTH-type transcriptional repressor YvoA n=1 Tax=Halalkalibacter krulwichiae TaxID=199441 RepID=A0A1X9M8N1_9BACI|nr:GntR family transcriptional regulator [Halalkalibacter krulwichiae]ARK29775.1 HTH-type transcriptional repressor YvoA [Halalkalibacter krulwichiae]
MKINIDNPVPLHIQIRNIIEKEINEGHYQNKIPSERDLMERFSVSRTTIREAITALVNEGVLKKVHGKGTFISEQSPVQEWLSSLNSFTETVKNMGMEPGTKLLKCGIVSNQSHIIDMLETDEIYRIERLRFSDSIPTAIERHHYNKEIGLALAKYDLNRETIYDLIEKNLGVELNEAEQFISCKEVSDEDAHLLEVKTGSSILYVERLITNANGEPVEYYTSVFRPDMYAFRIKTKRKK